MASNKQFNNLSQPSLAADRELDDLKERVKVSQCTEIFGKHEIIEKTNAGYDSWLTSTTMKTYNSNAERGDMMRHWPLEI